MQKLSGHGMAFEIDGHGEGKYYLAPGPAAGGGHRQPAMMDATCSLITSGGEGSQKHAVRREGVFNTVVAVRAM